MQIAYTVSDFVDKVREHLVADFGEVVIQGEVVDFRPSASHLVFFDLKDAQSRLRCFLLRNELKVDLADGMEIRVLGVPSLFKKNGGFHVRVSAIELVGAGALQKAFLALQKKLADEGLFALEHKKSLPRFPFHIALVTSPDAAAYTDVIRVLRNRFRGLTISLYPTSVQGIGSVRELTKALRTAGARDDLDAIILTRGGGSMEDLQSFNAEEVARVIFASRVPVVVGVGHERDTTIADFVADVRAATPSNAAELTVPDMREVLEHTAAERRRLVYGVERVMQAAQYRLHTAFRQLTTTLARPGERYRVAHGALVYAFRRYHEHMLYSTRAADSVASRLLRGIQQQTATREQQLAHVLEVLRGLSPHAVLQRGYSITYLTRTGGRIILKSTRTARRGDTLTTRLSDGDIHSKVQ